MALVFGMALVAARQAVMCRLSWLLPFAPHLEFSGPSMIAEELAEEVVFPSDIQAKNFVDSVPVQPDRQGSTMPSFL